uniref:WbqC family protein n=1 Tax=Roseivirga sp. TaxID=1964215 RepID=UPI004048267D
MKAILIESQYLPSVAYFSVLYQAEKVIIEANEWFEKRSYRNRCTILTANGPLDLTVPVHGANKKILTSKIEIDNHEKWVNNHWRTIQSAYGKSPFFDFYADGFESILKSEETNLFNLNQRLLTICLKYLQIDTKVTFTTSFEKKPEAEITDLRSALHPRIPLSDLKWFNPHPYQQIFGSNFVSNLSILDLLFCTGPEALKVLKQSIVMLENN